MNAFELHIYFKQLNLLVTLSNIARERKSWFYDRGKLKQLLIVKSIGEHEFGE